jgi:hypothetical protein
METPAWAERANPTVATHCYETEQPFSEQMFCFHGRSDGGVFRVFDSGPLIKTEEH